MSKKKTKTETTVTEQIEEQTTEVKVDETLETLKSFAEFAKENLKNKVRTTVMNGHTILNYYNKYTGRTERFTNCTSCIAPKYNYLLEECQRRGVALW